MSKNIEIVIAPNGQTKVETTGFAGESCREASRFIEHSLGERVGEVLTAEFHQTQAEQATHQQPS